MLIRWQELNAQSRKLLNLAENYTEIYEEINLVGNGKRFTA